MTKSVTVEGDVYDPSGTMTGGSAPAGQRVLVEVQQMLKIEAAYNDARAKLAELEKEEEKLRRPREQWKSLTNDLEMMGHKLKLLTEQIEGSNANRVSALLLFLGPSLARCRGGGAILGLDLALRLLS